MATPLQCSCLENPREGGAWWAAIYGVAQSPTRLSSSSSWIIEKTREFQKNIYFCFIYNAKVFDCVDHNKLWKILKWIGIPEHLTCLLKTYIQVRKQQLELDMEQLTGSK